MAGDNRPVVAQAETPAMIRDRKGFKASALTARTVADGGFGPFDSGRLSGADEQVFRDHCTDIEYAVFSYVTPIAWWSSKHGWYRVKQRFTMTTSAKHQSRLYLIPDDGEGKG